MKLVRFFDNQKISYGKLVQETVFELNDPSEDWCSHQFTTTGRQFQLSQIKLLAPCCPSKVVCLGLNYRSHAEEFNQALPESPILFIKPSTAVIGSGEAIVYPAQSRRVDYEAELGVVIGRRAWQVSRADALNYVFGYTCANDVTARDKQPAQGQWTYAKGFDTFCPLGPSIETDIEDPESLSITGFLNGVKVQAASTADHVFPVAAIIAYITGCMTLLPGDVILTGTPSGVGPMEVGDRFEVAIDGVGNLLNTVKGAG